jgi:hypothetical protein
MNVRTMRTPPTAANRRPWLMDCSRRIAYCFMSTGSPSATCVTKVTCSLRPMPAVPAMMKQRTASVNVRTAAAWTQFLVFLNSHIARVWLKRLVAATKFKPTITSGGRMTSLIVVFNLLASNGHATRIILFGCSLRVSTT